MSAALTYLVLSVALCWLMLIAASMVRSEGWTPRGLLKAFGNRDDLGEASALAGRMDRAAKNMLENLLLFGLLVLAAQAAGKGADPRVATGAMLFFWARLAYAPLYWAGVKFLRTAVWAIGVIGMLMIGVALV
ncbi:MAPEG family protein [Aquincola sp. S2]|uniref:MAPEG family protein n=1 Tax=Pseudaquabacterium terrae TaxID=2732868 RepID=A0ABX2EAP3_9BURK|nr:MAPEG family protein [Aquabacterium terrae]NRF66154.1 MAPEG family protein [Aquabacterium terrae]